MRTNLSQPEKIDLLSIQNSHIQLKGKAIDYSAHMKKKRWQKIETIIDKIMVREKIPQKRKFIRNACNNDEQLYKEVTRYLNAIEKARENNFLDT